ncbi:MAG: hypothetical protein ABI999_15955 [Acidobacteriota bacterium]
MRNFYNKESAMASDFWDRGIDKVRNGVAASAGWIWMTSKGDSVAEPLGTGRLMQRPFLKVREKNIALHPMAKILEESWTKQELNRSHETTRL